MSKTKYLVIGAGKSGVSAAKLLLQAGEVPVIYDSRADYDYSAL
jgi:cation diffusion facilitator CzcD-associated flavoprotein CzcO